MSHRPSNACVRALTMHGWTAKHYVISAIIILVVMGMFAYSWA